MGGTNHFYVAFSLQQIQQMFNSCIQHFQKVTPKSLGLCWNRMFQRRALVPNKVNTLKLVFHIPNVSVSWKKYCFHCLKHKYFYFFFFFQVTGYSGEVLNRLYGSFRREFPTGVLYRRSLQFLAQIAPKYLRTEKIFLDMLESHDLK